MEKVVFTFGWEQEGNPIPPGSTTVEISLHPEGDKTRVRLVHSGLPDDAVSDHGDGWQHYLERLADPAPQEGGPCRHGAGSNERMNVIALHDRALDSLGTTIEKIDPAQLGDPTPCSEFDVRALLNHVIGGNLRFVAIAAGRAGRVGAGDRRLRHRRRGDAVPRVGGRAVEGVERPGCARGDGADAVRRLPGRVRARHPHRRGRGAHLGPSKATGQPTELDPELCEAAWERTKDIDDSFRGPGRPFGPAVAAPPDATPTERLVAWLGRQTLTPHSQAQRRARSRTRSSRSAVIGRL